MENKSLAKAFDSLYETVQRRESAQVYQLALWSEPKRGVPNEVARSALFAAVQPNKARYIERQVMFSQSGFTITYTGKQLTQSDLDVFEGIMHIARGTHEGNKIRFRARELLKVIDRHTGKSQYQWLLDVMGRLTATCIAIHRDGGQVFWGSLLPEGSARLEDGSFTVEINRQLIKLFKRGYTVIEWKQRRALAKKPLAQHLHAWICSHERPYPVTVEYLRKLTGSDTKKLYKFRQLLKAALNAIQATGAICAWEIDRTDKVHIAKSL
jgi:hypothetical protein